MDMLRIPDNLAETESMKLMEGLLRVYKGSFQKRFSGFCPLRGYPPYPLNGKSVLKKEGFFP